MKIVLSVPLFRVPLWVFVGEEERERFSAACLKHFGTEVDDFGCDGKQCGSFLWILKPDLGMLVHELHHYAGSLTKHLGIEDQRQEVEAYVIGWAVKKIWPKITKGQP